MVKCANCGIEFDAGEIANRVPCPRCGEIARVFDDGIRLSAQARDHVLLELRRDEHDIAFRESERNGRMSRADDENGLVTTSMTGPSPEGETDTLAVCNTLVRKLGDSWVVEPADQNSDCDCVARKEGSQGEMLLIQVVKGIVDNEWWRRLAITGSNAKSGTPEDLADAILEAVNKKFNRTGQDHRLKLIVAVDANRLPGLTLDSVVKRTREQHRKTLTLMGFRGVWLVGPSISRTFRLDG